ncbi:MAG: hypothetical protein IKK59_00960 [Lachnospiraceae bacterium]|nr:hypothetical protein [Lachnospiraceae bacterium]
MKKILATILAATMVISMAACGGRNNESTENTESQVVSTETTGTETVETETTATETEGAAEAEGTAGEILFNAFKEMMEAKPETTAQEAADALITNEIIQFMGGTMPVEQGLLSGFDNAEIKGFEEGVVFMPMLGSIPFIGYIFDMPADADLEAFMTTLKESANMRWQVCVEAEEMVVEAIGDKVFFLMCKKDLSAE